ncbi:FeoA family protein [Rhodovulum adriaticum]|nr:FeoA family protein [Rhodovulum adriaticum]
MGRGFFGRKGWGKRGAGQGGQGACRGSGGGGRLGQGSGQGHGMGMGLCAVCPVGDSLNDCAPGTTCRIRRLMGCGAVRQRLLDLGIRPDREVKVVRNAPLNDPIELQVGDSFIVLRRREAAQIEVEDV